MNTNRPFWVLICLLLHSELWTKALCSGDNDNDDDAAPDVDVNVLCIPPPLIVPSTVTTHARKVVIAHRGASAHLPEHTVAAYRLALELGADYVEPDLVATKDHQLIAIHSMDLNVTTDVATKFPNRQSFSNYLNRTGYWSYQFTLEEIKTLRVRQRLPAARSTLFDGLFEVPTLTELFELIQDWHTNIDPLLINSTTVRAQRGIYAELKDYPWLLEDAGIDLVDLLFQHMQENQELWETVVLKNLCSTKRLKIHDLRLPPLILQSFEAKVLQSFTEQWETRFIGNSSSDTTDNNPVPPTILLVPREKCLDDNFWFQVDDTWRDFLSGLGPDKECLFQNWRVFMEHATKSGLVVHPWTERPELEYIGGGGDDTSAFSFESVLDELTFLFCTVGVHGVFSESVQVAVLAASIACPENSENSAPTTTILPEGGGDPHPDGGNTLCYETDEDANLYIGLASFTLGMFLTVVLGLFVNKRQQRRERRPIQIPTVETTDDDDDDDNEML